MSRPTTIRDLVRVQSHPTVVRLDDLRGDDTAWITTAYYKTPAVEAHLSALRHALIRPTGCGVFLIGSYGSGKSHFLAYLAQAIESGGFVPQTPEVAALSLLNYRGDTPLESVVEAELGISAGDGDRRPGWSRASDQRPRGLLLIIDELSEFLRSKPDRRRFTEDVRFLQFLGEWAQDHRFWILAALQEQIEHVGQLEHGLYRKIKDRYPIRFLLSPSHVRDLVRDGILEKTDAHAEVAAGVAAEVSKALPDTGLDPDEIATLYPLHPATLDLLEELRDCFSQARGVVDFTVTQLAGDPARGVEPFLDRPVGDLLTPELIIDHFRDLLEIQPQFLPLTQRLFPFYERHLEQLFEKRPLAELAGRLVKLLALVYLSPAREDLSAEEAASWLLYRPSKIDPDKNIALVRKLLKRLAENGRHVVVRGDRFRLDFEDEGTEAFERELRRETAELDELGETLFELIAPLLAGRRFDPFELPRDELQHRVLRWHFHDRGYQLWLGNEPPPATRSILVCLCLPWAEAGGRAGAHTLVPQRLVVDEHHREMAALARLRDRPFHGHAKRRLETRLREKLDAFEIEIRDAYLQGELIDPTGAATPLASGAPKTFRDWLEQQVQLVFRRIYPAFESFAPAHGPIPKDGFRQFMRFALSTDLASAEADDYTAVIREAYLVPMRLLTRQGRGYIVPNNIEKNELVRLVLPLLEHKPVPKSVHEHLSQPIYGLVPDQIRLLLVFMLILGEIDIVKNRKSYRDLYESHPDILQYDSIVPGRALDLERIRELEILCQGLGIRTPRQWTVIAQRQAVQKLREKGRSFAEGVQPLLFKLEKQEQGERLAERLRRTLEDWHTLDSGNSELEGFETFHRQIGSSRRFLGLLSELRDLPGRIDRLLSELGRYRHLFADGQPALLAPEDVPGDPPPLDEIDRLETWLRSAAAAYERYKESYATRHDAWWASQADHPAWHWRTPAVAASRHLALSRELAELESARNACVGRRCGSLGNLDFQPRCSCEFDGDRSPVEDDLKRFAETRLRIERDLASFFARDRVRERVRAWLEDAGEAAAAARAYVDGRAPYPEVTALEAFDRHLAGVDLVTRIAVDDVSSLLAGHAWDRRDVVEAFARFLADAGAERVRFEVEVEADGEERAIDVATWCLERALEAGVALPGGLTRAALEEAGRSLRPDQVGPVALSRLDRLGLPNHTVDRILGWLTGGILVAPPPQPAEPRLLTAARELAQPSTPRSAQDLARLSAQLYAASERMLRIERRGWLARLAELAATELPEPPPELVTLLETRVDDQWLIIDCLGLPWLELIQEELADLLGAWRLAETAFARVSERTTTDACYAQLIEAGLVRSFVKIDALDRLVHERSERFDDLQRLAAAELRIACRRAAQELDADRCVTVFGDHGFRLAPDGSCYRHGGASTLERVVPVLTLRPR